MFCRIHKKGAEALKMTKIGILLSGAASKGAYEYGFLKAIDEFFDKDEIKCVSSASIGMLAAQTYGVGKPQEFERIWKSIDPKKHGRLFLSYGGPGEIRDEICMVFTHDDKPFFEHYVAVWNFTKSKVEYIPFHTLTHEQLQQYIKGAIAIPILTSGEIINGDRILDGAFVDNIPAYPLMEKDLDYILCIYFDNHKYFFENEAFDSKILKFYDFPNQRRLETLAFTPNTFDEMAQYGYDYTLKTLNKIFASKDKATIDQAIKQHNDMQDASHKPRLTVDVVLNNINVMTRKYAKRMSNWEKAD